MAQRTILAKTVIRRSAQQTGRRGCDDAKKSAPARIFVRTRRDLVPIDPRGGA
jgi:hypothetical protein